MLDYLNPVSDKFILKTIIDYLNPFSDNFILKSVIDFLGNIISYINPFSDNFLGKKIVESLQGVLEYLFVPDNTLINEKIEDIKLRFSFVDNVKQTINEITNIVYDENNSPTLSITVPENRTGIREIEVINLSWYANYKTYGDTIICCFVYAFFFWRIFIKIPAILSGTAGNVDNVVGNFVRIGGKEGKDK